MNNAIRILTAVLALGLSLGVAAETRYVTDQLKITLRAGEGSNYRILRMLPSGSAVQVLGSNAETGYSHVRIGNSEGYVLTRQLLNQPAARDRLATLQKRVDELTAAPSKLQQELDAALAENRDLSSAKAQLETDNEKLTQDYTALQRTASNAVQIADERNALRKQVAELTRENADLKLRSNELENSNLQRWFLIGAGVMVGGILLGLVLPNLKLRRRRSSWDSL